MLLLFAIGSSPYSERSQAFRYIIVEHVSQSHRLLHLTLVDLLLSFNYVNWDG